EAIADLEQAIHLRPDDYRSQVNLSWVYRRQGKQAEALHHLDRACQLGPPPAVLARLHAERARIFSAENNHTAAVAACRAALRLQPGYADAYGLQGYAFLQLKDYEQAARSLTQYLQLGGKPDPAI